MVENFDLLSVVHMHFVHSLLNGRSIYDEKQAKFNQLPKYVVFLEASLPPSYSSRCKGVEDIGEIKEKPLDLEIPTMLSDQLVPLFLQKSEKNDLSIINGIVESISSDFNTDTRQIFPSAVKFLCAWHGLMRKRASKIFYNFITTSHIYKFYIPPS